MTPKRACAFGIALWMAAAPILQSPALATSESSRPVATHVPPTILSILAAANTPSTNMTTYSTFVQYPDCDPADCPFVYTWNKTGQHCGKFNDPASSSQTTVWDFSTPDCPSPPHSFATITVTATDGVYVCTAQYNNGSEPGNGPPGSCQPLPPNCERDGTTLIVNPRGGRARMVRRGLNLDVFFGDNQQPDASCNGVTTENSTWINFQGSSGDDVVTLDHSGGPFENAGTPTWFMFDGKGGTGDALNHIGNTDGTPFSVSPDGFTFGAGSIGLNGVEWVGLGDINGTTNELTVTGGSSADTITIGGEPFTVSATGLPSMSVDPTKFAEWNVEGGGGNDKLDIQSPGDVTLDWDPADLTTRMVINTAATGAVLNLLNSQIERYMLLMGGGALVFNSDGMNETVDVSRVGQNFALSATVLNIQATLDIAFLNYTTLVINTGNGEDVLNLIGDAFGDLLILLDGGDGLDLFKVTQLLSGTFGMEESSRRATGTALQDAPSATLNVNSGKDQDVEVEASGFEKWAAAGTKGKDKISGAGGRGTGTAFIFPLTLNGLGGNDSLTGGNAKDRLTGGPGTDTCNGGKAKDTYKTCETVK